MLDREVGHLKLIMGASLLSDRELEIPVPFKAATASRPRVSDSERVAGQRGTKLCLTNVERDTCRLPCPLIALK